ncbi:MAG: hypothetical protein IPK76_03470 [Lewinellaceae bacterium]|nr:hypothetical protein [Lewinellaceae bacterium]
MAFGNFPVQINPADGSFSGIITNCGSTEVSLVGYDLNALKSSLTLTKPVSAQVDFGNVVACDNQIVPGILIEFENGTQKWINNATVTFDTAGAGIKVFNFHAFDDQGSGNSVTYQIAFLDWNQNPANPLWGTSTTTTISGQPVYYIIGAGDVEIVQQGTLPGELVIFKNTNAGLREEPGGALFNNCTVTITAIIQ